MSTKQQGNTNEKLKLKYVIGPFSEPWQWANTWNISFLTLYGGQFMLPTQLILVNYPIWGLLTHVTHDEISNSKLDIFTIFCKWVDNGFIWTLIIINCRDFQNCVLFQAVHFPEWIFHSWTVKILVCCHLHLLLLYVH